MRPQLTTFLVCATGVLCRVALLAADLTPAAHLEKTPCESALEQVIAPTPEASIETKLNNQTLEATPPVSIEALRVGDAQRRLASKDKTVQIDPGSAPLRTGTQTVVHRGTAATPGVLGTKRIPVAIKHLLPEKDTAIGRRNIIGREATFLRKIQETRGYGKVHFVRLIEEGENYLATEWIEGRTLEDLVAAKGITAEQAEQIMEQLEDVRLTLKEAQISHDDLVPDNILITPDFQVKVIDFGIAVGFGQNHRSPGRAPFASPTQRKSADPRYSALALGTPQDNTYSIHAIAIWLSEHVEGFKPKEVAPPTPESAPPSNSTNP